MYTRYTTIIHKCAACLHTGRNIGPKNGGRFLLSFIPPPSPHPLLLPFPLLLFFPFRPFDPLRSFLSPHSSPWLCPSIPPSLRLLTGFQGLNPVKFLKMRMLVRAFRCTVCAFERAVKRPVVSFWFLFFSYYGINAIFGLLLRLMIEVVLSKSGTKYSQNVERHLKSTPFPRLIITTSFSIISFFVSSPHIIMAFMIYVCMYLVLFLFFITHGRPIHSKMLRN